MCQKHQTPQSNTTASYCVAIVSAQGSNCRLHELKGLTRDSAPCPVAGGSNALVVHTALPFPFLDLCSQGAGEAYAILCEALEFSFLLLESILYISSLTHPSPHHGRALSPQGRGGTGILSRETLVHPSCPEVKEIALQFCWLAGFQGTSATLLC